MSLLDPRGRLVVSVAMAIVAFLTGPIGGLCLAVAGLAVLLPSLPTARRRWRALIPITLFFLVGAGVNVLFLAGDELLWRVPVVGLRVTRESLLGAITLGCRAMNLAIAAALVGLTTPGAVVAHAGAALLAPLGRLLGSRIHVFLFQMQLAIRFVPLLLREGQRVRISQSMRGHRLGGSVVSRVRGIAPILIPVLAASLLKAHRLSLALCARGYVPGMPLPVRFRQRWRVRDTTLVGGSLAFLVVLWRGGA
jgi:energy-coupling factor transporter transmembrane protein EcfT